MQTTTDTHGIVQAVLDGAVQQPPVADRLNRGDFVDSEAIEVTTDLSMWVSQPATKAERSVALTPSLAHASVLSWSHYSRKYTHYCYVASSLDFIYFVERMLTG